MFSYPKEPNKMTISSSSTNNIEEFSFPIVSTNPLPNIMLTSSSSSSSSLLWRISSRVYHHPEVCYEDIKEEAENDVEDIDDYRMEVRSMCEEIMPIASSRREIERSASSVSFQSKDLEVKESMDYLWEDFNEEDKKEFKGRYSTSEDMGFMEVNKFGRRTSNYYNSKSNSNSNSNSRSSTAGTKMLVLGKFLKGLVSIRKSAQIKLFRSRF